ncbi:VCBS repeat-containing protein [Paenibacillus sp. J2TS4]|uniref:VCBS repeat-containing protein n=1 Tax=Paenibacillus sp. J2TS4 TaxID=2807194 RepID=UPI001B11A967|nr:VCBS repeat-containing protein [Paenibacillus sp. J2TS4]GIP34194.1 hypothetical protein J2TS4_34040 [Paenibacillus sp. J2TS4]
MYGYAYGFGPRQPESNPSAAMLIVDRKIGDVNGDHVPDMVYLVGSKSPGSPFIQHITLLIQDGRTRRSRLIPLPQNAGYNPTVSLKDFTGDRVDDILIRIDSGGSGAFTFDYVFSYVNNQPRKLFDAMEYNEQHKYTVHYLDGYKAQVKSQTPMRTYIIDLTYKGRQYLSEIYDANGKLKEPIQGDVNPLSGLEPVDFERDGQFELMALQRITGRYNADGLGYVMNILKWNGARFTPSQQWVWIMGKD